MRFRSICLLVAALLLPAAPVARAAGPDIKPGLWERTITMEGGMSGVTGMPELDKVPPEQRAQIEKLMAAMTGKPTIVRECVTAENARKWEDYARDRTERGCTSTVTEETAKRVVTAVSCDGGASTGTLEFVSDGPEHMTGTFSMVRRKDGKEHSMRMKMISRWLGAECGDVAPDAPKPVASP